ncbi:MAG: hypothetical protein U0R18_01930 [Mycobacterium sp.]
MATKSIVEAASAMALGIGILLSASPANALPRCVNTSNYTTQCESNGNSQITTFPGPSAYNSGWPGWGWGWGGFGFGFGFG